MEAKEIRKIFLNFFKNKKHQIVSSAPMVLKNDPTLMFTNAGMNQFKDYFLGHQQPTHRRIADTQKCLRVSGKHNDLEEVGIDTYHHTMFEMLGNWSFGEYFKKEAIAWAWELLTEVYLLPKERLYVTVFRGDAADKLEKDEETIALWKNHIAVERIILAGKKDNFWEMGETGPCGPCSEIHIDLRKKIEITEKSGIELVNANHPLVVEIWNLVFIQFNRMADGSLQNLPEKHIDTGMGFERITMAIQNKHSNYDTDIFQPLINYVAQKAEVLYGADKQKDIAIRVISDHIRAIAFAIADGQLPSNNKAGYVIRRILRRAVRYGYNFLHFQQPFLFELVAILSEQFEEVFPEIKSQQTFIEKVIRQEEISFLKTLNNGLKILHAWIENNAKKQDTIPGKTVFDLYDTFGFPADLTALIARENKLKIDEADFMRAMQVQKKRSQKAAATEKSDWIQVQEGERIDFVGYDHTEYQTRILAYRTLKDKKKNIYQVLLEQTPFYAESGGQVGDTGYIQNGKERILVIDTQKENNLIIHILTKLPTDLQASFQCKVDTERRGLIANNHTATHLMHAALRQVLGNHVAQRGSLVNERLLRFDFSHYTKMSTEEIARVEQIVNQKIRGNITKEERRNVPIAEAKGQGATAFFGEKYGDYVRMITFDKGFSIELCGGIHVPTTGNLGFFKITSENAIAAGVRRIEAITAEVAENFVNEQIALLEQAKKLLKQPKNFTKTIGDLFDEKVHLEKELKKLQNQTLQAVKQELIEEIKSANGISFLAKKISLQGTDQLRQLAFEIRTKVDNLLLILAAEIKGKPQIAVMLSESLIESKGLNAVKVVKELAQEIEGGGGGQAFFATAGGKDLSGLERVVEQAVHRYF